MKAIMLLMFVFLGYSNILFSQPYRRINLGVDLGTSISRNDFSALTSQDFMKPYYYTLKERYMSSISILLKYSLSNRVSLSSGVSLLTRFVNINGFSSANTFEDRMVYNIVEIPLYFDRKVKLNANFDISIKGGIAIDFLCSSRDYTINSGSFARNSSGITQSEQRHEFVLVGSSKPIPALVTGFTFNNKLEKFGSIHYGVMASFQTQREFYFKEYHYSREYGQSARELNYVLDPFTLNYIKLCVTYFLPNVKKSINN